MLVGNRCCWRLLPVGSSGMRCCTSCPTPWAMITVGANMHGEVQACTSPCTLGHESHGHGHDHTAELGSGLSVLAGILSFLIIEKVGVGRCLLSCAAA